MSIKYKKFLISLFFVTSFFVSQAELVQGTRSTCELIESELDANEARAISSQYNLKEIEESGSISRLTTHQEHVRALEDAFKNAQKAILVTNYGELYPNILNTILFKKLIPQAYERGVKIYLRYNYDEFKKSEYPPIPPKVQSYFKEYGIDIAQVQTHAKIVAVDHQLVMMGSFNWLSDLTSPDQYQSLNHSFVYEGTEAYQMTEEIWKVIKYYRNKKFGMQHKANFRRAYLFKRNPDNQESKVYSLGQDSRLSYVPVIDAHRLKILDIFEQAKDRIIILSPFVANDGLNTYQRDFVIPLLSTVLAKGVKLCFVCLPDYYERINGYLNTLLHQYPNLKLLQYPKLHAKTFIKDEDLIAEGSFNLLLAARDEISGSHKHEATLICEGAAAKDFIQDFYKSKIGKFIQQEAFTEKPARKQLKRKRSEDTHQLKSSRSTKSQKLLPSHETTPDFFHTRKETIAKDMWVHHPFWVPHNEDYLYFVYGKFFEIMSGNPYGKKGYCVRVNKQQYLSSDHNIVYFSTQQEAKAATYRIWKASEEKKLVLTGNERK